jgi:hypothetical protein
MGNNQDNTKYQHKENKKLKSMIEGEIKNKNKKEEKVQIKDLIPENIKKKINIKKSNITQTFNKNEKGIKNISDIINLIYNKNINTQLEKTSNNTVFGNVFHFKDSIESRKSEQIKNISLFESNAINDKGEDHKKKIRNLMESRSEINQTDNISQNIQLFNNNDGRLRLSPKKHILKTLNDIITYSNSIDADNEIADGKHYLGISSKSLCMNFINQRKHLSLNGVEFNLIKFVN